MPTPIPIAHSLPDPAALGEAVARAYRLPAPVRCTLVSPGVNDTYQVDAGGETLFYRVYRAGWRTRSDIEFELELLRHLEREGVAVSVPIARADGTYIAELAAPEGPRPAVLFARAPGQVLAYVPEDAYHYGCAAARLHTAMDRFQSPWTRFRLDREHLLEEPLRLIRPFAEETGHWPFYNELAGRLRSAVQAAAPNLEQGLCHGDLHGHNVHKNQDGQLTFFDFDCGGPGWRAVDLAAYRWAVGRHARNLEPWDAFLEGYRTVREVRQADLEIVPAFVAIRNFWLVGMHAGQVKQRGTASVRMWVEGAAQALKAFAEEQLSELPGPSHGAG
jgi:Ser/Thr protein kinase RdoA (MazF antagonist)